MQDVLWALAQPRRIDILRLISDAELASGEIAAHFNVSRPAISQHLQILKSAGLVNERRVGTRHLYRTQPEVLVELREYLDQFWAGALERLAKASESDQRGLDSPG